MSWNGFKSFISPIVSIFKSNPTAETNQSTPSVSSPNDDDDWTSEKPKSDKRLADAVKKKSTIVKSQKGPLPVYKVPLKDEQIKVDGCKRYSFGKDSIKPSRTIIVLGATGAGKSTHINGMINYILGVDFEDPYRFKLVDEGQLKSQAHSQTSEVTVYKLNHQEGFKIPYSLTIVDTPGFGDTRGIDRDKEITEQLRNLFNDNSGVSEIDAVCFVAQASLARLTPTQKYVFDSVLSIFGKDVAENIRILVTFADGQPPPVLEAIKASGVPCPTTKDGLPVHFKFNNSAVFANNKSAAESKSDDDDDGGFDQMFWDMGTKSMKRFFVALNVIETKSLKMTKEVLRERQQLENSIENLQKQVKVGLAKLDEIKETSEKLKEHEAEISRNENFEFEVTVTKPFQKDITGKGHFLTNCQVCSYTCHGTCRIPNDADKRRCFAMGPDGYCNVCPGECYWNVHFNQKYTWEYRSVKEKRTVKELKDKYLEASEAKAPIEVLFDKLKADYDAVQAEVEKLIERSGKCLNRLKEIALKPNPLSTPEYIDMLIEGEKSEAKPGWKKRVQALMVMREKAECMGKVERGEKLLQSTFTDFQTKNNVNQDENDTFTDTCENHKKIDSDTNNTKDSEAVTDPDRPESDTNDQDSEVKTSQESDVETYQESDVDIYQDKSDTDTNGSDVETNQDSAVETTQEGNVETSQESNVGTNQDKCDFDSNDQDNEVETSQKGNVETIQDKSDTDINGRDSEVETSQESDVDIYQDESDSDTNVQVSQVNTNQEETNSASNTP